ncbi:MAG TPA: 50S ribosomal protein L18 [Candidatus Nanoarchaeia archaeon]|nr:50S ribosomal protein L18 [Candidatus Nanoarchaeia archaeon]
MKKNKIVVIPFKRKLRGKTNYRQRMKLIISNKPRLIVRKSLKGMVVQIVEYIPGGDKVLASASSSELRKIQWNVPSGNIPSAYLMGLLLGKKATELGIKEAVLDVGLQKTVKGSRIFAVLKGVVDAGVNVPHSAEILPSADRLSGAHISAYAGKIQGDKEAYSRQFGFYIKSSLDPKDIPRLFEAARKKIMGA